MRLPYEQIPLPSGRVETRPCASVVFEDDPDEVPYLALVDSGSLRSIAPLSAFEGLDLGEPEAHIDTLRFVGWSLDNVPIHRLPMRILAPDGWEDVPLPPVAVAVADAELPFVVLGSSALQHVVVIVNDADQLIHIKPREMFCAADHYTNPAF